MADIVLSTYFTTKKDPMRKKWQPANAINKTRDWITSLSNLKLHGIIFYDALSEEFILSQSTKYVQFVKYELKTEWSLNDERYLCYKEFLDNNSQYTRIFMTDLFDVTFHKNPFDLINDNYKLYVGSDTNNAIIKNHPWIKRKFKKIKYCSVEYENKHVANAGVLGGNYTDILLFLNKLLIEFISTMYRVKTCYNINMAVFNKTLYDTFHETQILVGNPLTSTLMKYQKSGNFAIKHK